MKKAIAVICALLIMLGGGSYYYFTQVYKTDEEQITECLNNYATAYSAGDSDALCDCLDSKSAAMVKGSLGLVGSFVNITDMLGLGFSLSSIESGKDLVEFDIKSIEVNGDNATVKLNMTVNTFSVSSDSDETVKMVKENNKWKINVFG